MNKEAFVEGYITAMDEFGMFKSAEMDWVSSLVSPIVSVAKYPVALGAGVGVLGGVLANYANAQMSTPEDADLEILENRVLAEEAGRHVRGLHKLRSKLDKEEKQPRRAMRTGL